MTAPADPAALVKKYEGQSKTDDEIKEKPVVSVSLQGSKVTDVELGHLRRAHSVVRLRGARWVVLRRVVGVVGRFRCRRGGRCGTRRWGRARQ